MGCILVPPWRTRLNRPCAAAMRPCIRLLWLPAPVSVLCGRLNWLAVCSYWAHVDVPYRIVSYREMAEHYAWYRMMLGRLICCVRYSLIVVAVLCDMSGVWWRWRRSAVHSPNVTVVCEFIKSSVSDSTQDCTRQHGVCSAWNVDSPYSL